MAGAVRCNHVHVSWYGRSPRMLPWAVHSEQHTNSAPPSMCRRCAVRPDERRAALQQGCLAAVVDKFPAAGPLCAADLAPHTGRRRDFVTCRGTTKCHNHCGRHTSRAAAAHAAGSAQETLTACLLEAVVGQSPWPLCHRLRAGSALWSLELVCQPHDPGAEPVVRDDTPHAGSPGESLSRRHSSYRQAHVWHRALAFRLAPTLANWSRASGHHGRPRRRCSHGAARCR